MNKELNTLVTIVVPCFNQGIYLNESLESVCQQSIPNWECIIVDDGSSDQTKNISSTWLKKDKRFRYYHQENSGLSSARNYGISKANGPYILPLDADDKISDDYIELALRAFEINDKVSVVYAKTHRFEEEQGLWYLRPFSLYNLAVGNLIFCSAIYKKSDWERVGGYDVNMLNGLEDWEFWINLLKDGNGEVKCLNKVCFYYRVKKNSMLKALDVSKRDYLYQYISIKHADFFVQQFGSFHSYMEEGINDNRKLRTLLRSRKHALKVLFRGIFNFKKFK